MKRMSARWAGTCGNCRASFPAGALIDFQKGAPKGRKTFHVDCNEPAFENDSNPVIEIITSGGTFTQRRGGRCEDAPCCGCCTF